MRTTAPSNDNKYYIQIAGGGYNHCIQGNASNPYKKRPTTYSVLPNCVGYAYGRYLEYWGLTKASGLPTCNAKDWYSVAKSNGYKCSKTPTVGSVAVFSGNQYGHVAFVEEVKANGDIVISESNWSHAFFAVKTITKSSGYLYCYGYPLIGFVANPNAKPAPTPTPTPTPSTSFLPSRGYFAKGDVSANVGKIASYMYKTFPSYTSKSALGDIYGDNLIASIKEFQRRTGLKADGLVGKDTLTKLKSFGFKE